MAAGSVAAPPAARSVVRDAESAERRVPVVRMLVGHGIVSWHPLAAVRLSGPDGRAARVGYDVGRDPGASIGRACPAGRRGAGHVGRLFTNSRRCRVLRYDVAWIGPNRPVHIAGARDRTGPIGRSPIRPVGWPAFHVRLRCRTHPHARAGRAHRSAPAIRPGRRGAGGLSRLHSRALVRFAGRPSPLGELALTEPPSTLSGVSSELRRPDPHLP